jgi:hypothetical protein
MPRSRSISPSNIADDKKSKKEIKNEPEDEVYLEPEPYQPIELDPTVLEELNRIVDDSQNMKFKDPGNKRKKRELKPPESSSMPAVESSVDDALVGTIEYEISETGEFVPTMTMQSPSSSSSIVQEQKQQQIEDCLPVIESEEAKGNGNGNGNGSINSINIASVAAGDDEDDELNNDSQQQTPEKGDNGSMITDVDNNSVTSVTSVSTSNIKSPNRNNDHGPNKERLWRIDAISLGKRLDINDSNSLQDSLRLQMFLKQLKLYKDKIASIRINGILFTEAESELICSHVWEDTGIMRKGKFPNLIDLDLSYLRISSKILPNINIILNPTLSGYCPIKRLVLTQCRLGIEGTRILFKSLKYNVFIEELIINGNHCTDVCMDDITATLNSSANRFKLLSLGANDLTHESMSMLANSIKEHSYLKDLQLNNNPNIKDNGIDIIFTALRDNQLIENLNLSYCGLKKCSWAGKLRIMTSLAYLNLSQNEINDDGCLSLCDSLEKCVCLRHLDLSYNLLGDRLSIKLGVILKINQGLQTLNLSGNIMTYECWNSIAVGLCDNYTLLNLNLTMCDINLNIGEKLYECLIKNNIVTINMSMNPLPYILTVSPRLYSRKGLGKALCIDPNCAGTSLIRGQRWREGRLNELKIAKKSLVIIDELEKQAKTQEIERIEKEERKLKQKQTSQRITGTGTGTDTGAGETTSMSMSMTEEINNNGSDRDSNSDSDSEDALSNKLFSSNRSKFRKKGKSDSVLAELDDAASSAGGSTTGSIGGVSASNTMTSSMLISLGANNALKSRKINKKLDDGAVNDNEGKLILSVCYGRESEILGTIEVKHNTTYPDSKKLIKPLIKEYLANLGTLEMAETLIRDFDVLDSNGSYVTGSASTVRTVWAEAAHNHHRLIVRPANWIKLPSEEDAYPNSNSNSNTNINDSSSNNNNNNDNNGDSGKSVSDIVKEVNFIALQETEIETKNAKLKHIQRENAVADAEENDNTSLPGVVGGGPKANPSVDKRPISEKKIDPNYKSQNFVAFEYDDDVFGPGATDDMSVLSYDDYADTESSMLDAGMSLTGGSISIAEVGSSVFIGESIQDTLKRKKNEENKVKWV